MEKQASMVTLVIKVSEEMKVNRVDEVRQECQ